jgi:hypothetical protein
MIPVLLNGFAPATDRETTVSLMDETGGNPHYAKIAEGRPDDKGLVRLEVDESWIGKTIVLIAMANGQRYMAVPLVVYRCGIFETVRPVPDPAQLGHQVLALPANWRSDSVATMHELARVTTFPSLALRRAREDSRVRYAQHFTALWSAFNAWYNDELPDSSKPRTDRECIELLKIGTDRASRKVQEAINVLAQPSKLVIASLQQNPLSEGRRRYRLPTSLSSFVRCVYEHPVARQGSYVGNSSEQPLKMGGFRPKCAPLAHLSEHDRERLYKRMHEALASPSGGIVVSVISLQDVLRSLGIGMTSSFIYPAPPIPLPGYAFVIGIVEQECKNIDITARMLRVVTEGTSASVYHGFIELLYSVRNLIVHGTLSPFDQTNEEVLESAYKILDSLVVEISKT